MNRKVVFGKAKLFFLPLAVSKLFFKIIFHAELNDLHKFGYAVDEFKRIIHEISLIKPISSYSAQCLYKIKNNWLKFLPKKKIFSIHTHCFVGAYERNNMLIEVLGNTFLS